MSFHAPMAPVKVKKKKRKLSVQNVSGEAVMEQPTGVPKGKLKKRRKLKRKAAVPDTEAVATSPPVVAEGEITKKRSGKAQKAKKRKAAAANLEGDPARKSGRTLEEVTTEVVATPKPDEESTVFVDGVPYVWSVEKVKEYFSDCGVVREVRAPTWQDSGRLRGFAHVTFADQAGRNKALAMDGTKVDKKGRYLKIEAAKAPGEAKGPTIDVEGKRRLFVKNLPYDATEKAIGEIFGKCGKIREVRVPTSFGRSKGFAYVEFARSEHLKAAIEMQPPPSLGGRTLRLDADVGTGPKAGFHYRPEAFESGFGPSRGGGKGKDGKGGGKGQDGKGKDGKGKGRGKGRGKGLPAKLSLF